MKLDHEQNFHWPDVVPPTPDTIRLHLEHYHSRIRRVLLKRWIARGREVPLLSATVHPPSDTVEEIGRTITGRAQADEEERGEPSRYIFQVELESLEKKSGNPPRKTVSFYLGDGGEVQDHLADPMAFDQALLAHLERSWTQIHEMAKTIAKIGEVAIERTAEAFGRERQALEIVADARVELENSRQNHEIESAKIKQNEQLIELLKPAVGTMAEGMTDYLAGKATRRKAAELAGGAPASSSEPTRSAALVPVKPAAIVAELVHETREEALEHVEHANAYIARVFGETIQSSQWFELADTFSKKQIKLLHSVCQSTTDTEAIDRFRALSSTFKPGQQERLEALLDNDQKQMIARLWIVSSSSPPKGVSEHDGSGGDAEGDTA